jgi:hypothetical protein
LKKKIAENYYKSQKSKLLRDFDNIVKRTNQVFVSHYGKEQANILIAETRQEYDILVPQIPYIGGRQPLTQFLIATAQFLAMYRVLKKHGQTLEETGVLIYEVCQTLMDSYPKFVLRVVGHLDFSKRYRRGLQKRAAESHQRQYPDDYVFNYIEGDGKEFDFGVDYIECGGCKFLQKQGAPELAPYLCTIDILYSETFGWGLIRKMTLSQGFDKCDFRFKKGGETRVAVPASFKLPQSL